MRRADSNAAVKRIGCSMGYLWTFFNVKPLNGNVFQTVKVNIMHEIMEKHQ